MKEKTIQEKVLDKMKVGKNDEWAKSEITKAISFAIKFRNTEVEKKVLDIIDNSGETDARTNMEIKKEIKDKLRKSLRGKNG